MPTELGRSRVEVQRCPLGSDGLWLTSNGAHCAQTLAVDVQPCPLRSEAGVEVQQCLLRAEVGEEIGEELARPTPAVEVQQCPLRAEVGEEIGDKLARRKWTWKLMQTWSRRNWRGSKRSMRRRMRRTALIKSNNPHLAGRELMTCMTGGLEHEFYSIQLGM